MLPGPLLMVSEILVAGFKSQLISSSGFSLSFDGCVATVFENPSIDASDIEINRTGSEELVVRVTGFNDMVPLAVEFDPPLAMANRHVNVSSFQEIPGRKYSRLVPRGVVVAVILCCRLHVASL